MITRARLQRRIWVRTPHGEALGTCATMEEAIAIAVTLDRLHKPGHLVNWVELEDFSWYPPLPLSFPHQHHHQQRSDH